MLSKHSDIVYTIVNSAHLSVILCDEFYFGERHFKLRLLICIKYIQ